MNTICVLGHLNMEGNERADELVRSGAAGIAVPVSYPRLFSSFKDCLKIEIQPIYGVPQSYFWDRPKFFSGCSTFSPRLGTGEYGNTGKWYIKFSELIDDYWFGFLWMMAMCGSHFERVFKPNNQPTNQPFRILVLESLRN